MTKQSGMGDNLYVHGVDLSGDIGSLQNLHGGAAVQDVTGINRSAIERLLLLRDGGMDFSSFFNKALAQEHKTLSPLPTTDILVAYFRGTALGSPAACLNAKQLNHDGTRAADGSFVKTTSAQGQGYGLEWGSQLTAGRRVDVGATAGTGVDFANFGAPVAFGLQAYLHVFAFTGTDATIRIQESSDNGVGDAFANVTGGAFTAVTAAPFAQRIETTRALAVERYLRVTTSTTGGFTSLDFAVVVNVNPIAVAF